MKLNSKLIGILIMVLSLLCLTSCNTKEEKSFESLDDFSGATVGYLQGAIFEDIVDGVIDNVSYKTYLSTAEEVAALKKGDIDAIALDMPVAELLVAQQTDFMIFPQNVVDDQYGLVLQNNSPYTEEFTKVITKFSEDGTIDKLKEKWFSGDEERMVINWSEYELENRKNGTLRYRFENTTAPMGYTGNNGEPAGYEVELVLKIANELDMGVSIDITNFASLINFVSTDMADVASGCVSITEEREEKIDFPAVSHYIGGAVLVCKKDDVLTDKPFIKKEDFEGETIGMVQGSSLGRLIGNVIDGITFKEYDDIAGQIAALTRGDVSGLAMDMPIAQHIVAGNPDLAQFPETLVDDEYGMIFEKGGKYSEEFSKIIEEFYKDGTIDKLKEKWFSGDEEKLVIDWSEYNLENRKNGTLNIAYVDNKIPMSFKGADTNPAGYEVELVLKISDKLDMGVSFVPTNFGSLINYITSKKADVGFGGVSITEERKQSVDFATSHYVGGAVIVCSKERLNVLENTENKSFLMGFKESFEKTFIKENRWKLIVNGLYITLEITFFAGILGTILGFFLCLLIRSKKKWISNIARAWSKLIQGIPSLVVLMIIYFVVFGSSNLSPVIIGIIAFGIMFSVSVAGILNSGINAVDGGQWEAASALGFNPFVTFTKIILPPAVKQALPLYVGELVAMLKLTSIVGYISIEDLTKASDIIRSRTFEAFFPLITTAIIYFMIATAIYVIFSKLEKCIDPLSRPRRLPKGVRENKMGAVTEQTKTESSGNEEIIRIEHLKKVYPNATPLKDVNASIKRGEVISIIGPSGTGKSTLIRCINRLETPTEGRISILGEDVCDKKTDLIKVRRKVGMVFQSFNLFGHLTVIENVMLAPTVINKIPKQEAYNKAMELLRMVGVGEKALNYPSELSGGQKQRVAIARCLAMEPDILLLDEPTSALDPTMVGEVQSVVKQLSESNYTMMIVSHEMQFVKDVSTRIFYMDNGVICEEGTPKEIFEAPEKEETRAFVKRMRSLEYEIKSRDFDLYDLNSTIEKFAKKYFMSLKQVRNIQLVSEELIMNFLIKNTPDIKLVLGFFEVDGSVEMKFTYGGAEYNPFKECNSDDISMMLVSKFITETKFEFNDLNSLVLKLSI